ncbi:MAG: SDR family NAD(P)-dependent oxidoreductase [bacterium]
MRQDLLRGASTPEGQPHPFVTLAVSPGATWDPSIPIAAARAGAIGVLDLTLLTNVECALGTVARLNRFVRERHGLVLHGRDGELERTVLESVGACDVILLTPESRESLRRILPKCRQVARQIGVVVTSVDDLESVRELPIDFLIAKGVESGGWVGGDTSLALLERLRTASTLPVYVWGGVGPASAGAYLVAGAHGLVLDWQLALTRESPLPRGLRHRIEIEGGDTALVALGGGSFFRCTARTADRLRERLAAAGIANAATREQRLAILERTLSDWSTGEKRYPWPVAEDASLAVAWRAKAPTVARALAWTRELCAEASTGATVQHFLVQGGGIAPALGVGYPILQRCPADPASWEAFAGRVANAGSLAVVPLERPPQESARAGLDAVARALDGRAWCVDLTGCAAALESSRWLAIVETVRPPLALLPESALDDLAAWEHHGTRAFLAVGSEAALAQAVGRGVRRVLFPAMPASGAGAAPSLGLWDDLVRFLVAPGRPAAERAHLQVLLDAGSADPTRAAALQVVAEPLVELGIQVGLVVRDVADEPASYCDAASRHLVGLRETTVVVVEEPPPVPPPLDIAIVGMSCFLPGADDVATYWRNILNGVDAISEVPGDRFDVARWFDADKAARDKVYSKWGGFIGDIPFDPLKYGIPPAAIRSIEPIQLLTLELVDRALRDAGFGEGYEPPRARTAVLLGAGGGMGSLGLHYAFRALLPEFFAKVPAELLSALPEWTEDSFPGVLPNVITGRITNRFDFGGVNFTVDAACASSLAAVYLASQELTNGTADLAIAGGVDPINEAFAYTCFSKTTALSPRGRSRAFDASADGIAIAEGLATVVLKRRVDAERDGDRIYAVIKGVQGASDGRHKGLTAPRLEGQMITLERSYAQARVSPASLGLVEAHGTGTGVGDPTETQALGSLLERAGARNQSVGIGSIKSMIGHAKSAAGVAGLIKAALALHHRVLPPTLHVESPNPKAGLTDGPIYVSGQLRPWIRGPEPRRAGVSAFGFGGTNFHAVLEEYEACPLSHDERAPTRELPVELVLLGGATAELLRARCLAIANELASARKGGVPPTLADVAYTLHNRGLAASDGLRAAFVARSLDELGAQLEAVAARLGDAASGDAKPSRLPAGAWLSDAQLAKQGKIAFLFPGQGSQFPDMLRDLAIHFPEVARRFEIADRVLADRLPQPLSSYVFPPPAFSDEGRARAVEALKATHVAQPALGAADVAVLRLLERMGVRPHMAGGHSYGELVALGAAGSLSEEQLFALSHARGQAISDLASGDAAAGARELGQMVAIRGAEAQVRELVGNAGEAWVANLNSRRQIVVSGTRAGLAELRAKLDRAGLAHTPVPVACAFHSPIMRGARERFESVLQRVDFAAASFPVYSNWTAAPYAASAGAARAHLAEQLVSEVRFADEIEAMYAAGARVFVEVGPNRVLSKLVGEILEGRPHVAIATQDRGGHGVAHFLTALARLHVEGASLDLERLWAGRALIDLDDERDGIAASAAKPLGRHFWLVNSAYARPAHEPPRRFPAPVLEPSNPSQAKPASEPIAATTPGAASEKRVTGPAPALRAPDSPARRAPEARQSRIPSPRSPIMTSSDRPQDRTRTPRPASPPSAAGRSGEADAEPVREFQETMRRFLETQQAVMQAYFGASDDIATSALPVREAFAAVESPSVAYEPPQRPIAPAVAVEALPAVATAAAEPTAPPRPLSVSLASASTAAAPPAPVARAAAAPAPQALDHTSELKRIVTERTGYPPEMLELDAGLESDLGIDSIKRVEIIAAFRRAAVPAIAEPPAWFMEAMGTATTLRMILDGVAKLAAGAGEAAPVASSRPAPPAATPAAPVAAAGGSDRVSLLRTIVTDRTGYPPEMLDLTAGLESDLGIDSIKRVEIIAAFRKAVVPHVAEPPAWFMESMGSATTLQAILDGVERLAGDGASAALAQSAPSSSPSAAASTGSAPGSASDRTELLKTIVSDRTGYPVEMLDLHAGLESDLGIDSIKRVEIIAAFRRAAVPSVSEPPAWFMEEMSAATTLDRILAGVARLEAEAAGPVARAIAVPAPSAPASAPSAPRVESGGDDRVALLRSIVSDRTGYPVEMLDLDAGLEADLGIDSIKRVEIIAAFRRTVVPAVAEPPAWFMESMSSATTLRAILDGVAKLERSSGGAGTDTATAAAPLEGEPARVDDGLDGTTLEALADESIHVPRSVVRVEEIPLEAGASRELPRGTWVLTEDGDGLAQALGGLLRARGVPMVMLEPGELATRAKAEAAFARIRSSVGPIGAVLHLLPLREAPSFPGISGAEWQRHVADELRGALFLLQAFAPELKSGGAAAPLVAALTRGGGDFDPARAEDSAQPWRGGLAGLFKSAAQEWPKARFRVVDYDRAPDASTLLRELAADGPVEVGYRGARRLALRAVRADLPNGHERKPVFDLGAKTVILATGGARGITAEIVHEIARHSHATVVLAGRSPVPDHDEDPDSVGVSDRAEIRRRLLARLRAEGGTVALTPKAVEDRISRILQARELRRNLASIREVASHVEYRVCDVRDPLQLTGLVHEITERFGGIDVVLHGAGVIEDKYIVDKTAESFDRVLGTKLDPMLTLTGLLDPARIKLVMLFSSVAGIFGNVGQADYATANEVLNRIARRLHSTWHGKVVSMNWGPWVGAGSMVTPEVAEQLASRQFGLVSVPVGRQAAWLEFLHAPDQDVRVVVGTGGWLEDRPTAQRERPSARVAGSAGDR